MPRCVLLRPAARESQRNKVTAADTRNGAGSLVPRSGLVLLGERQIGRKRSSTRTDDELATPSCIG